MEALQKKAPDLEPCDQPQAQEALRFHTAERPATTASIKSG